MVDVGGHRGEGEELRFASSSAQDQSYARSFWQSVHLVPPLESRLVSSGSVHQRLKSAPPLGQPSNARKSCQGQSERLLLEVRREQLQRVDTWRHLEKVAHLRSEDQQRIERARLQRIQLEQRVSHPRSQGRGFRSKTTETLRVRTDRTQHARKTKDCAGCWSCEACTSRAELELFEQGIRAKHGTGAAKEDCDRSGGSSI